MRFARMQRVGSKDIISEAGSSGRQNVNRLVNKCCNLVNLCSFLTSLYIIPVFCFTVYPYIYAKDYSWSVHLSACLSHCLVLHLQI